MMGEAGPEAILPLNSEHHQVIWGRDHRDGWRRRGSERPSNCDCERQLRRKFRRESQTDSAAQGRQLGNMITAKVKDVIGQEMRPWRLHLQHDETVKVTNVDSKESRSIC